MINRCFMISLMFFVMPFDLPYAKEQQSEVNPELTEVWEPMPPVVTPGPGTAPPSDAIAL